MGMCGLGLACIWRLACIFPRWYAYWASRSCGKWAAGHSNVDLHSRVLAVYVGCPAVGCYMRSWIWMTSGRTSVKIKKGRGPRTEPWRSPTLRGGSGEKQLQWRLRRNFHEFICNSVCKERLKGLEPWFRQVKLGVGSLAPSIRELQFSGLSAWTPFCSTALTQMQVQNEVSSQDSPTRLIQIDPMPVQGIGT